MQITENVRIINENMVSLGDLEASNHSLTRKIIEEKSEPIFSTFSDVASSILTLIKNENISKNEWNSNYAQMKNLLMENTLKCLLNAISICLGLKKENDTQFIEALINESEMKREKWNDDNSNFVNFTNSLNEIHTQFYNPDSGFNLMTSNR